MNLGILLWIALIVVSAAVILHNKVLHAKITKEGITTKSTISLVDETYDDDTGNTTYTYYVNFVDEKLVERKAILRGAKDLNENDMVILRYHPANPAYAEFVRKD